MISPTPDLSGAARPLSTLEPRAAASPLISPLTTRLLVALTSEEASRFFPEGIDTNRFGRKIEWHFMPEDLCGEAWREYFCELRPHVILGGWKMPFIPSDIIESCPDFRYLCYVTGSVRKRIDRSFVERGGVISNWGDAIAPSVAECGLMLTLMGLRQATRYALEMHIERSWPRMATPRPLGLFRRKVGIHGFGSVARALLPLLRPFDVTIEAYSAPVPAPCFAKHGVRQAPSLEALYRENDVVILAEALTPATAGSVTREILLAMKPGSVFVNVARGAIVEEDALLALVERGDVQVGLDVFAVEPLPADSPLRCRPNVSLLPHTAGPTIDWYPYCGQRALNNLELWLNGQTPGDVVTLERYDLST